MRLAHFGIQNYPPGNAGDTVLFVALRALFKKFFPAITWLLEDVRGEVTEDVIERVNTQTEGVIVGGGGLFLKDTNNNKNSGWQWNCPVEALQKITKPVMLFAVGYNRFRGQEEFEEAFFEHIAALGKQSKFIGLRNNGSIEQLSNYLPLHANLFYQPCPTVFLNYLFPSVKQYPSTKTVAINAAFDRRHFRYGQRETYTMESIRAVVLWLHKNKYNVDIVCHCGDDQRLTYYLENIAPFRIVRLDGQRTQAIINYYRTVSLVIGMRGHAQMIPLGLGIPILSVITHNKLAYFLKDIEHQEWGIEISNPSLADGLTTKIKYIFNHYERVKREIADVQKRLWEITLQNMARINAILEEKL